MTAATVSDRVSHLRVAFSPTGALVGLAALLVLGFVLVYAQEPTIHAALHDFRHAAGIPCH